MIAHRRQQASSPLRVSLPVSLGRRWALPALLDVAQRHPLLRLDLSFTNRRSDLVDEGIDRAVRIGDPGGRQREPCVPRPRPPALGVVRVARLSRAARQASAQWRGRAASHARAGRPAAWRSLVGARSFEIGFNRFEPRRPRVSMNGVKPRAGRTLIIERREKMALRSLGTSTIQVSPLVFGGNVFGWTADENTSFSLLDALADAGINFIDTADVYSAWVPGNQGGESETIIGKWLKRSGKRDQVVIATKVGLLETRAGLSRENILKAADDSLRRLQTDYIDLYFSHRDLADTAPLEETLGAYQTLIEQGKVRIIGASNYSGARLREAAELSRRTGLPAYQVIQPEYNLYDREAYERDLEPAATELRLGVVTYYALASGFLSGKYRSEADLKKSARGRRVEQYLNPRGLRILAALDAVAAKHGSTQTSVALAWQMARPSVTAPIASATSLEQLSALGAAIRLQLDAHDIRQLDDASAP
ncbi:oxidoreductase, aldo/keto reductase family [Burkholderia pseudomallei Pasteur 52237]|nr:oxidoreductase, aldo/keto reductase family [Burkholderia pseudomallei Pasteur 52237]